MEQIWKNCDFAVSLARINKLEAIKWFDLELTDNSTNFFALYNRGLCKLGLAFERKNNDLLEESQLDFKKTVDMMKEKGYKPHTVNGLSNLKEYKEAR